MINTAKELKDLITWAKENKVLSIKINNIEFKLSELSFLPEENQVTIDLKEAIGDTLTDTEQINPTENEELLYWSTIK